MNIGNTRFILLTLALVQFVNIVDFMVITPLAPQLMRVFSISPREFSFLVSIYSIAAAAMGFSGVFFLNKLDRKGGLRFFFIGFTLGTLACALAPDYPTLLVARMFTGFFGGVLSGLSLSIVGDVFPPERRGAALGAVMAAFSVATVAGVPLGLYLANKYAWNTPFFFLAAFCLPIFGMIHFLIPSLRDHIQSTQGRSALAPLREILRNPNQLRAVSLMALLAFSQFMIIPFIAATMVANVGFSESDQTYIFLIGGFATLFSAPLAGKWADKIGKTRVFTIFAFLSIAPFLAITNMPPAPLWVALICTTLFFITSNGRAIPAIAILTGTAAPHERAGLMSVNSFVQHLSIGVGSSLAGMIIVKTPEGRLENYGIAGLIGIFITLICVYVARGIVPLQSEAPQALDEIGQKAG